MVCMLKCAGAGAYPFTPPVMKLSAPPIVEYSFGGSELSLPVDVSGSPACVFFLVFTRGKGASIGKIRNGYLGWHYVNNIDTCLYVSPLNQLDIGHNIITWHGVDEADNPVSSGDYTYYLWGVDNVSARIPVTRSLTFQPWGFMTLTTHNEQGLALAQPVLTRGNEIRPRSDAPVANTVSRWIIGGDPTDETLLQTTTAQGWVHCGGIAYLPSDYNMFFYDSLRNGGGTKVTRKFQWVPGGASVLQLEWGENGGFSYVGAWPDGWNYGPGCVSDGGDYLFVVNADISGAGNESQIIYLDVTDGMEIKRLDLADWWVNVDDALQGGKTCGGPTELWMENGVLGLGSHMSCVNQVINPYYGDEADAVVWSNTNGDIIGDRHWEAGTGMAWVCNDDNVGPYKYNFTLDSNLFALFPSYGSGTISFGLYAPDGTGLAYLSLAGETLSFKFGDIFIDYGSSYDGLYTSSNDSYKGVDFTISYIGHDSIRGVITRNDKVIDVPSHFSVAQNVPNPFNPSTVINFTLSRAGKVTVEVFNTAGQKVADLANGFLCAGRHSVVWNASYFSAGVYYYTVKADGLSRTMKMTLLK
jgi:hypothetical protein